MHPSKTFIGSFEGEGKRAYARRRAPVEQSFVQDLASAVATLAAFGAVSFLLLGFVYPGMPA